ncbi:MAG: glycosyltransferase family 39 protein [Anaerolineales bacterium]|nr:glycosyltransferase family 39 protein [Anaerolineales bacterium]
MPYNLHPDEHQYVDTALTWHTTGELETRFVNLPLFTYFLIAVFAFWFAATPFEPTLTLLSHTYLFARLWSVAFSLFTVALMYPLGKKLGRPKMGLLAAALMAGLFLPAREAHFAVNDTFVTFLVLLTLYFCLKLFWQRDQKSYIIAGAMVGLTTGTKLTAALVILPVLVAHVLAAGHKLSWPALLKPKLHLSLGWALLAAAGTFLIVVLPLLWQLPQFLTRLGELAQFGAEGFGGVRMGPATGWQFYLDVLGWGMGWTMLAALLAVLGYILIRYKPEAVILLIFPLVLFAYMGSQKAFSARYLLPAVPPLVLLVTLGLSRLAEGWSFWRKHQTILMPLALFILLGQSLVNLVWFDYLLTRPNTQQLATTWFIENFPEDTVVAKEPYSILPETVFLSQPWPYKVITLDRTDPARSQENYYLSRKTELIAVSNFTFARIREKPAAEQIRLNQLKLLAEKAILLKEFNPYRRSPYSNWFYLDELYGPAGETLQRVSPGPLIRIYRLPYENQPYTTEIPPISVPVEANFANKLVLLGYDLPARRANPGESFPLTLYWQAAVRLDQTYVIFNHLLDQHQQNWGGYDRWPQETANTVLWQPGEVVVDTFNLPVAVNAPPGIYTIDIGLYNQADRTATPLSLLQNGQPINQNSVRIGPVKVGEAPPEIRTNKISPQYPLSIKLGQPPLILFHGYDLLPAQNGWELTLYWESLAQTPTDWTTFIHLRNETGQTVAQKDGPTGRGLYPTSLWDRGDIIVDHIILPTQNIPAGRYNLFIGLYDLATGQRLAVPSDPANEFRLSQQVVLSHQ